MDNKEVILEVEDLLNEAKELIAQGNAEEASAKVEEAQDKLRPIGSGTNGPRPKNDETSD